MVSFVGVSDSPTPTDAQVPDDWPADGGPTVAMEPGMIKKPTTKKLSFGTETVRRLSDTRLASVAGGWLIPYTTGCSQYCQPSQYCTNIPRDCAIA
jgi:hypothetical protein